MTKKELHERFHKVLFAILDGQNTSQYGIMWNQYKEHLQEDLPEKLREKFLKIKNLIEKRVDENVRKNIWYTQVDKKSEINQEEVFKKIRESMANGQHYLKLNNEYISFLYGPLHNFNYAHSRIIKTTLLELVEATSHR